MSSEHSSFKQKAKHELNEMLVLSAYLAFFLCALSAYKLLLLKQYQVDEYWNFGFALINALVITKVIMIGEYAKVGRGTKTIHIPIRDLEGVCIQPARICLPHCRGNHQTAHSWRRC